MVKTNFTSAKQAASNVLRLTLDTDESFSDAGGKAFAWGLERVSLAADANNAEYRSDLWLKSMVWARIQEGGERLPLDE